MTNGAIEQAARVAVNQRIQITVDGRTVSERIAETIEATLLSRYPHDADGPLEILDIPVADVIAEIHEGVMGEVDYALVRRESLTPDGDHVEADGGELLKAEIDIAAIKRVIETVDTARRYVEKCYAMGDSPEDIPDDYVERASLAAWQGRPPWKSEREVSS